MKILSYWIKKHQKTISISFLFLLGLGFYFSIPRVLFRNPTSWVLEDEKGDLLSASIASDGQWRFPEGDQIPYKFKKALINFEDKRFYYHLGFDIFSLFRAIGQNIKSGKIVSGGSTLTMQLVRIYRKKPRTFLEKFWEIVLAFRIELTYSKEHILRLYSENAPFGSNIVGLEAASWRYFGRKAQRLSWAESCLLAVLPNNPKWVNPGKNKLRLQKKRDQLMKSLWSKGIIDFESYRLGIQEPLPDKPKVLPNLAPHLLEFVKKKEIKSKNTLIRSSLHGDLQAYGNQVLQNEIPRLNANYIHNAAILVLDVNTGSTLAYIGNISQPNLHEMESDVDIIQAPRSPGSTLKPLLYASMLKEGLLLPHSLVADIPSHYNGYSPQNFDLSFDGVVPASEALSRSLNVPAVRLLYEYTYPRFYDQLKKLGITTLNQPADFYGLSLILGGEEVTLWDLCGIYASMARTLKNMNQFNGNYNQNDFHAPIYSLTEKKDLETKLPDLHSDGLLDYPSIAYTFEAMEEVQRPGDEALWREWSSSQRIAWKTGTSFGFRDAWAIGLTPNYVVGVWVGNATGEGRPNIIGVKAAAPILFKMFRALPYSTWFPFPTRFVNYIRVCKQSGYKAGEFCDSTEILGVSKAGVRSSSCPFHQLIHLNATKTYRINSDCPGSDSMIHKSWFVLTPTEEWFYKIKNPFYKSLPPFLPNCSNYNENYNPIDLIYPEPNAKIYVPIELNGKYGKVVFKAVKRGDEGILFWYMDKKYLTATNQFHEFSFNPNPGKHTLMIEDEQGNTIERTFEVDSVK